MSTLESGSQIFFSCSTVRHVAQSFSVLTTTAIPSLATWISVYSMPFFCADRRLFVLLDRARGVGDVGLAGAEALEAAAGAGDADRHLDAGVLLLERPRPPAVTNGPTVLEPSTSMRPERS